MNFLIIPVDVKARSFESRLLLSCYAVESGYNVLFGSSSSIFENIKFLPKGVFLAKSIAKYEYNKLLSLKNMGYKILCLDEEGLISHENRFTYLNQRISYGTLDLISKIFTWGQDEANIIKNNYPNFSNKIKIVGNPRIDLWNTDYKFIYKKSSSKYKKIFGRYILFPSNFAAVNHAGGPGRMLRMARIHRDFPNQEHVKKYISYLEYKRKSFDDYIELIKKISRKFRDINIIVRPHHSEDWDSWNKLKRFPNINVIYEGSITPWILGSEIVIHNDGTTGLEAYLLGKPVISYVPYFHINSGTHISNGVSLRTKRSDSVLHHVENILNQPNYFRNNLKIWSSFGKIISISNERLACEKIVNHLNLLSFPKNEFDYFSVPKIRNFFSEKLHYVNKKLSKNRIFKYKYSNRFQKFPGSSLNEVKEIIGGFQSISGRFKKHNISKISNNLYLINK